jgi:hypothetical protein
MRRFLAFFLAVLVLGIGCAWIYVVKYPMCFLDSGYPQLKYKTEMALKLPANSIVILGDSRAEASLIPARIGPDVYNLSISASTSIDTLAISRILVSSPHPLSPSPLDCILTGHFWDISVRFGLLDLKDVEEIRTRSRYFNDPVLWSNEGNPLHNRTLLFGPKTPFDIDAQLKTILYTFRFPSFFFSSLISHDVFDRHRRNIETYRTMRETRGWRLVGTLNGTHELAPEADLPTFLPSPLLDSYLAETIGLFKSNNIPVYFVAVPFNENTIAKLHRDFVDGFAGYLKNYELRYSNFHLLGDPFPALPWEDFGDSAHVNEQGALRYSDNVAALLRKEGIEN